MKRNTIFNAKTIRLISGGFTLLLMGVIFYLSSKPANESDEMSIGLLELLLGRWFDDVSVLNSLIRKAAHMLEYGALATPVFFFLGTFRFPGAVRDLLTVLFCAVYAASDEVHQLFILGRSGEARDVLVDTSGALLAVATLHVLTWIVSDRRKRKTVPPQEDAVGRLVLEAFSSHITGCPLRETPADGQVDGFIAKSFAQKILPMTAEALLASGAPLSGEYRAALKANAARQAIAQMRRTEAFLQVYRAMREAGASPLCVKGAVCRSLYPKPELRVSADEDLLASEQDFARCAQTLRELGFAADGAEDGYEVTYRRPSDGCVIELHRTLFPEDGGVYSRFNALLGDLFRSPAVVTIEGVPALCPVPDAHFLYLILHAFKHFLIAGVGVRQLADIALFARANRIDWRSVFEKCETVRLTGFLNAALCAGAAFFGLELSEIDSPLFDASADASALLRDVMAGGVYGSRDEDQIRSGNITFRKYADALSRKQPPLFAALFPPKQEMRKKHAYTAKHGWLLPAAYAARIIRYCFSRHDSAETFSAARRRAELMRRYGIF